jgi:hypothetical protein
MFEDIQGVVDFSFLHCFGLEVGFSLAILCSVLALSARAYC